ncbi:MAG TPA: sigma 54-interacting transcriptional regulator, partial [Polyangiaceae bacterium]|nr:sigma 54-interacting transcriptional regulator [Polyangiaceae bacterium]
QQSEVRRVGSTRSTSVNVRVLAATRRDLDREVQAGRFRDDLFFRLNVVRFELPPLRERRGDVAVLARHFWDKLGGAELPLPVDLFESWEDYAWPGNVRELENAVVRRLALGELAPPLPRSPAKANASLEVPFDPTRPLVVAREQALQVFEHQYLERLLALHDGDTAKAAQVAGVTRRYLNMLRARRSS